MFTNKSWHVCVKLALCLVMLFSLSSMAAEGERPNVNFNHDQTTFPLRGLHSNTACESCHINGVFKGTPSTCEGCHSRGGASTAKLKPATHIPVVADCSSCHIAQSWLPARFSHNSLTQSCATCHNGTSATGKPTNHIYTRGSCDSCHKTSAWIPAYFSHDSTMIVCSDCHLRGSATKKPNNHQMTNQECSSCHRVTAWTPATGFAHSASTTDCLGCHRGVSRSAGVTSRASNYHLVTTVQCSNCHIAGVASWPFNPPAKHDSTMTTCTSCHSYAMAKSANNIHNSLSTNIQCSNCHNTSFFTGANFSHTVATVALHSCVSCHVTGQSGSPAPSSHSGKLTGLFCDDCHRVTAWLPASYSHAGVNSGCTNCHTFGTGGFVPTVQSGPGHMAYTIATKCENCHSTSSWAAGVNFSHTGVSGYYQHSSARTCSSCHGSTSGGPIAHTAYYPNCAWCHSGQFRAGSHVKTQSPNRVLYTVTELQNCNGACHEYTNSTFTTIKTARSGHHRATDGGF